MREIETNDTIAAIATPPGEGAIGIVRVSGANLLSLVSKCFKPLRPNQKIVPFRSVLGDFSDAEKKIDQVLLFYYPAPRSYTGEEVIEIHAHGNPIILKQILHTLLKQETRLAEPGEFTKRAFLNGKLDLAQAEAVSSLIAAKTELAAKASLAQLEGSLSRQVESLRKKILDMFVYVEAAIDYPEEDLELLSQGELKTKAEMLVRQIKEICQGARYGKILKEGIHVAIVGKPNVGKSSLLNALLNEDRVIVTPIAGTTRDIVSEAANINGIPIKFIDTAGIRESNEIVEKEGIKRSVKALEQADIILFICDGAGEWNDEDEFIYEKVLSRNKIVVVNKSDLPQKLTLDKSKPFIPISAEQRQGLEALRQEIINHIEGAQGLFSHEQYLVNLRHEEALLRAETALVKALETLEQKLSGEFIAVDLREALDCLGEIVGKTTTDDILDKIFATFCIGK